AWTLATGRAHLPHRAIITAEDRAAALTALTALAHGHPAPALITAHATTPRQTALILPRPGTHWPRMGHPLYHANPPAPPATHHRHPLHPPPLPPHHHPPPPPPPPPHPPHHQPHHHHHQRTPPSHRPLPCRLPRPRRPRQENPRRLRLPLPRRRTPPRS